MVNWIGIILVVMLGALIYLLYMMMLGGAKKVRAYIYELRSDEKLHYIGIEKVKDVKLKDGVRVLIGKKYPGIWLRPPNDFIRRIKTMFSARDECSYLRIGRSYLPIKPKVSLDSSQHNNLMDHLRSVIESDKILEKINDTAVYVPIPEKLGQLEYDLPSEDLSYKLSSTRSMIETHLKGKWADLQPILMFAGYTMLIVGFVLAAYFMAGNLSDSVNSLSTSVREVGSVFGGTLG